MDNNNNNNNKNIYENSKPKQERVQEQNMTQINWEQKRKIKLEQIEGLLPRVLAAFSSLKKYKLTKNSKETLNLKETLDDIENKEKKYEKFRKNSNVEILDEEFGLIRNVWNFLSQLSERDIVRFAKKYESNSNSSNGSKLKKDDLEKIEKIYCELEKLKNFYLKNFYINNFNKELNEIEKEFDEQFKKQSEKEKFEIENLTKFNEDDIETLNINKEKEILDKLHDINKEKEILNNLKKETLIKTIEENMENLNINKEIEKLNKENISEKK